jgi:hypothetical protein
MKDTIDKLLQETDWVLLDDVSPYLSNLEEFKSYRLGLRIARVNDIDAMLPEKPTPVWDFSGYEAET